MLVILLCVEALEDNEVLLIEGVLQVTKVYHPKGKVSLEKLQNPHTVSFRFVILLIKILQKFSKSQ